MASKNKKIGKHGTQLPEVEENTPTDNPTGGFKPAFTPTGNKGVNSVNPYIAQGQSANSFSEHSRKNKRYAAKKPHRGRKVALVIVLVLAVVLVGGGVAVANYMNQLNSQMAIQDEEEAAQVQEALAPTPEVSSEPFYMMIIGSDTRHDDWGQRSDTNIVARIDPGNATVTLISIPRDTAINLEGYGTVKFNAAYNYYGTAGTINAASDLLGVGISHYAEIDFQGLVDLIDAVGGVDVDVPMRIEDADAGGTVEAGEQTLDGEHALIFARSRSYTTADFQRTTNQRLLVEAFINKVMSMPVSDLPGIVKQAAGCLTTDMSVSDILGYAQLFSDADHVTIYSALMPLTTATQDGVEYVVCDTETLAKMMEVVDAGGDPSTVTTDFTIDSSAEAEEQGESGIPVYTITDDGNDDVNDSQYYGENYSYDGSGTSDSTGYDYSYDSGASYTGDATGESAVYYDDGSGGYY